MWQKDLSHKTWALAKVGFRDSTTMALSTFFSRLNIDPRQAVVVDDNARGHGGRGGSLNSSLDFAGRKSRPVSPHHRRQRSHRLPLITWKERASFAEKRWESSSTPIHMASPFVLGLEEYASRPLCKRRRDLELPRLPRRRLSFETDPSSSVEKPSGVSRGMICSAIDQAIKELVLDDDDLIVKMREFKLQGKGY